MHVLAHRLLMAESSWALLWLSLLRSPGSHEVRSNRAHPAAVVPGRRRDVDRRDRDTRDRGAGVRRGPGAGRPDRGRSRPRSRRPAAGRFGRPAADSRRRCAPNRRPGTRPNRSLPVRRPTPDRPSLGNCRYRLRFSARRGGVGLHVGLDVDTGASETRGQPGVLSLPADGQRELVVGDNRAH